jgi:rubrerythrin
VAVQNRIYVKATATIKDAEGNTESVTAFAREPEDKKGMDDSQVTGTASSYARKYALNGLFLIDDTKDADTDENRNEREGRAAQQKPEPSQKPANAPRIAPKTESVYICTKCGKTISSAEHDYSLSKFGTSLCRNCQRTM